MNPKTARQSLSALAHDVASLPFEGALDLTAEILKAGRAINDMREENMRRRYARRMESMTLAEAKEILGLPAGPVTADQVSKAYKALALQNHPDRGGDADKMVDINVARDMVMKNLDAEGGAEDPADADEKAASKFMDENFEQLDRGWWIPPHNLHVNQTFLGVCNLWVFTILPMFPKKKAYSEKLKGIVIHPTWHPTQDADFDLTENYAKRIYVAAKNSPTVQETVRKELAWIETEFQIRIPDSIQAKLVKDALPTAIRRRSANRLRTKDRLIPLDGSKPRDLSSFEF